MNQKKHTPFLAPIEKIKPNPRNPRVITDHKFAQLVQSIQQFPDMLWKRPVVCITDVDGCFMPLGGNKRYEAAKKTGLKEIPIVLADEWTEEYRAQFIIKDNVSFGEWDWEMLKKEWNTDFLSEWGLDALEIPEVTVPIDLIGAEKNKPPVIKITFSTSAQLEAAAKEIETLLTEKYPGSFLSVSAGEI